MPQDRIKKKNIYPVWDFIEKNLNEKIGLNQIAFFSKYSDWHFHRLFKENQGENVQSYKKRLVIEKAAYELKITNFTILEIAIESGYESQEAFTKAFKRYMGETPNGYRKRIKVSKQKEVVSHFENSIIREINSFSIIYVRRFGSYESYPGPSWDSSEVKQILSFIESIDSHFKNHKWVGISQDDPLISNEDKIRFDLGIVIGKKPTIDMNFGYQEVLGGRYFQFRHRGSYRELPGIYDNLMNVFLPKNNIRLRNAAPFEVYLNPWEENEDKIIVDIYIPLEA